MIESNCEYLTVVKYANNQKLATTQKTLDQYFSENPQSRLNYENFIQLFIQSTHLIFTCKYYNIKPEIGKNDVRVQENHNRGQ